MKNRLNTLTLAVSIAGTILGFGAPSVFAQAASPVTITSESTLAPNAFGSPSYDAWAQNAITALETGATTVGAAGPSQFTVNSSPKPVSYNVATGFTSWLGDANPVADYGPAYASELGNRASSDVLVNGNGTKITLANLAFTSVSSDPGNALGFAFGPGGTGFEGPFTTYDSSDIGIIFGPDGHTIQTVITSGSASQQVDEIISVGAGDAYSSYTGDYPGGNQASINGDIAGVGPYTYTTTWGYDSVHASDTQTFDSAAVPDTGGWMLYGAAALGLVLVKKGDQKIGGPASAALSAV